MKQLPTQYIISTQLPYTERRDDLVTIRGEFVYHVMHSYGPKIHHGSVRLHEAIGNFYAE